MWSQVGLRKWCKVAQLCLTLCDPMDCSLPGSSIHGIFQARELEWVAISFSRRSSQPGDWTQVSHIVGRCVLLSEPPEWRWWNSSWAISNPERWCWESAALNMPANLEYSAVATGLEKISFHSNPKERQCQRMLKLLHNCTHFTC